MRKRVKDTEKLETVVLKLLTGEALEPRHCKHRLSGRLAGCGECRIDSDWLLVWEEDDHPVTLARTGTHSDLFS